jgi:thiol:disulfide interchange protein DsbD
VLGGLFTLIMLCTYPMIPFTIIVFTKQAANGTLLLPLAVAYALGIVGCFVGLGLLITGVLGASLSTLAGHPLTNLAITLLFLVLGASLLGLWFLRPPAALLALASGQRQGYVGALFVGMTFAVTAVTCTATFAGAVLSAGVARVHWGSAVVGMAIYGGTIALHFFCVGTVAGMAGPPATRWRLDARRQNHRWTS